MRLIILLAALAIALPFVISSVALPFGNAVYMRFLERPANTDVPKFTIPPETEIGKPLNDAALAQWVAGRKGSANGYATRVIPLDMLYLLFLGGFRDGQRDVRWHGCLAPGGCGHAGLGVVGTPGRLHGERFHRRYVDLHYADLAVDHPFSCTRDSCGFEIGQDRQHIACHLSGRTSRSPVLRLDEPFKIYRRLS